MSFFLRQLITESGAVSSSVPTRTQDIRELLLHWIIIRTFHYLPSTRQLHGSLTVYLPWDTLRTCLPLGHDSRIRVHWSQHALLSISTKCRESVFRTFLPIFCFKITSGIFSLKSNLPSNPTQSLNFLDLYAVDGIYCSTWYCTGVFNRCSYFTNFWSYDTWLLNSTVPWEYTKVPTKDLRVVYLQFVYPTSGNTEPNKWSWIRPYRCHLEEDPRHHTMVGIVLS